MKVLVDTSIWSVALRRSKKALAAPADELKNLIADNRVLMIGPIRQELLSGIRQEAQFNKLNNHLSAFPDTVITTQDYVTAATFFNLCRTKGVQGLHIDFLICAVAVRNRLAIFTTDKDFKRFAKHLPITLHDS